jgi:hypothetical protein
MLGKSGRSGQCEGDIDWAGAVWPSPPPGAAMLLVGTCILARPACQLAEQEGGYMLELAGLAHLGPCANALEQRMLWRR